MVMPSPLPDVRARVNPLAGLIAQVSRQAAPYRVSKDGISAKPMCEV